MSDQLYKCDHGERCRVALKDCPARPPHAECTGGHVSDFRCPYINRNDPGSKTPILVNCVPCDKRGRILKS